MTCKHENFAATVNCGRLTDGRGPDPDRITSYMADIRVHCAQCGRQFQFLGLEAGIDTQGARVSIDGLEAHIAMCPQGEQLSPLDRISATFGAAPGVTN